MARSASHSDSGNRPRVTISAAMSIDGKIASARGGVSKLSSAADTARVHGLRSRFDSILVGINTVISDDPLLTVRREGRRAVRNPVRIILDSRARTPLSSRIIGTSDQIKTIVAVSGAASKRRILELRRTPAEVVVMGGTTVDVRGVLGYVAGLGIRSVLVEGGGATNWTFVREGMFDEIIVAVSPYVLGGRNAVSLVGGAGFAGLSGSPSLRLVSVRRLEDHVVLRYARTAGSSPGVT